MRTRFLCLYNEVFDEKGEVKLCGRDKCQELILLANQVEKGVPHGNPHSCMMDINAMHSLYNRIKDMEFSL